MLEFYSITQLRLIHCLFWLQYITAIRNGTEGKRKVLFLQLTILLQPSRQMCV